MVSFKGVRVSYLLASKLKRKAGTIWVKEEMKIPSQLLEHVIQRIAGRLFHDFPQITEIKIALFKQNPPMGAECQETGVESIYTKD